MNNKVEISQHKIKDIIKRIVETKNNKFIMLRRWYEKDKDPYNFFGELDIDYSDAIESIKSITFEDYKYTLIDSKNKFGFMHVFNKNINGVLAYIKIGFKNDNTVIISFHKKLFDDD